MDEANAASAGAMRLSFATSAAVCFIELCIELSG
jgi:hypothetical protein